VTLWLTSHIATPSHKDAGLIPPTYAAVAADGTLPSGARCAPPQASRNDSRGIGSGCRVPHRSGLRVSHPSHPSHATSENLIPPPSPADA
jgi:hypothetical protein